MSTVGTLLQGSSSALQVVAPVPRRVQEDSAFAIVIQGVVEEPAAMPPTPTYCPTKKATGSRLGPWFCEP